MEMKLLLIKHVAREGLEVSPSVHATFGVKGLAVNE
jgi:hypothetical protein